MTNKDLAIAASTIWVVVAAILVMFMQAGFAFLEAGLTRMKNVGHIAAKNVLVLGIASIVYYLVGFGIAFGDGGNGLFGGSGFVPDVGRRCWRSARRRSAGSARCRRPARTSSRSCSPRVSLAIVWGAMAERTKLWVYFAFGDRLHARSTRSSRTGSGIPTAGCSRKGMQDFAGSTVVHYQGALAALAGALLLGPRIGKFGQDGKAERDSRATTWPSRRSACSSSGSAGSASTPARRSASRAASKLGYFAYVALTTNVAAAAGALGGVLVSWLVLKKPDLSMTAERRRRGARRDHRGLRLRRSVGGDRDRLRRRRDRRRRRPRGRAVRGSTIRSAPSPCTAWPASGARSRPASSPCRRWRRTSPPARAASCTRARSTSSARRRSASWPSVRSPSAPPSAPSG